MKILFLIAAVGHFSHGGKAEKTSAVRVFALQALYRDLIEAAKFKPPTHINCAGVPPRLAHQLHIHLDPAHLVLQHIHHRLIA